MTRIDDILIGLLCALLGLVLVLGWNVGLFLIAFGVTMCLLAGRRNR